MLPRVMPQAAWPVRLVDIEVDVGRRLGHWRFAVYDAAGQLIVWAEDIEPGVWGQRLELLTVVRALESLDQPAVVLLLAASRYLEEGLRFGLPEWRASGWRWEHFEQMVPIRNVDLWQRLDRALQFHRLFIARGGRWVACGMAEEPRTSGRPSGHWREVAPLEATGCEVESIGHGDRAGETRHAQKSVKHNTGNPAKVCERRALAIR